MEKTCCLPRESLKDKKKKRKWSVREGRIDFYGWYLWESLERRVGPWLHIPCSLFCVTGERTDIYPRAGRTAWLSLYCFCCQYLCWQCEHHSFDSGQQGSFGIGTTSQNLLCPLPQSHVWKCHFSWGAWYSKSASPVEEALTRYFEALRLCNRFLLLFQHTTRSLAVVL